MIESGSVTLSELQARVKGWADKEFPERQWVNAVHKLMLEEIPELLHSRDDALEYADVLILLLDMAALRGIDLESAVLQKMEINETHQWKIDPETGLRKRIK